MVISTKPAMLGNMPMDGNEKSYEKVAFMGQIPVKVKGIVMSGDYILPSGLNDGTGIAVSPNDIKVNQYQNIVGIAWSNSYVNNGVSTINMAIGLNANDMANLAVQQEKKITALENKFNSLEQRLLAIENGTTNAPAKANTDVTSAEVKTTTTNTPSRYEMIASSMPAELSNEVMEEAIQNLKLTYEKQGITIKNHPGLNKLFTDASFKAEVIRKSQEKYRLSYQSILETAKK